ncbi:MAG: PKD domain-containing protein, partial [Nanoarchaeota archaeon]|nr:PKD domain-containing protein [Nanoarchaeota archaeon]
LIGELNISFTNHPINSLFTDSEGNSVELKDVLNTSSNYLFNYSCDVLDCGSSYESLEKKTTDSYVLLAEDELVIGLEFKGNIEDINSLDYTVQSNAPAACSSQFRVDFLDDGVFDYSNTNSLPISCDNKNTGCYNISQGGEETKINVVPFCQKIEVPETPKVELGVWLKEKTPGTSSIKMSLYDLEGDKIDECEIEKSGMTSVGSEVSCLIDYAVIESEDYYVCTSATNNDGDYRTKGYDAEEECGFYGSPVKNASANYYLFARGQKYNAPGEVVISNQLGPGKYSSFLAEEYLVEKYGSMNCESGCYVPIRIISNVAQTITLKDFSISYDKTNFPGTSSNEFHELNTTPAKVSSDMLWLSLNGLFNLSDEFGEFDYSLNLDGEELFEEELEIKNASIILNPTIVAAGFAVTFEAEFLSELNVTSYLWDFGVDGKRFETFSNKKTVTFEEEGNYTLVLMVDAGDAFFSKEFLIEVQSPKETIEKILLELNYKKENLETQILDLDSFIREKVKEDLNWANVSLQIELLKEKYDTAKITGNYSKVIPYTSDIDLPSAVIQSSSGKISYYPELSDIDVDIVSKVFGDFYEEENYEKYSEAILFFNMNDYQVKTSMKDVSYNWDGEVVPFAKTFYLDISGKNYDETKLFISDLKGLEFNIEPTKEGSYWVLPIRSSI